MKNSLFSLAVIAAGALSIGVLAPACSSSDDSGTSSSSSSGGTSGSSGSGDAGGGGDAAPGATPTFTEIYTNIIAVKCAGCHTSAGGTGITSGKLDMTSQAKAFADLVGVSAAGAACAGKGTLVVAGKPDDSVLYLKVSDDDAAPCGGKMPLGTAGLDAQSSDAIKAWITAGAKND